MSDSSNSRKRSKLIAVLATVTALLGGGIAALVLGGGATSANYASQTTITAHADGGTLKLQVSNGINYPKLVPGQPQSQNVTFSNAGNVGANKVTVGLPIAVTQWSVPAGQTPDWSQVHVVVTDAGNGNTIVPDTAVTSPSLASGLNLGSLAAGASKTMTFTVTIVSAGDNPAGDAKDNQFQGVSLTGTATAFARS